MSPSLAARSESAEALLNKKKRKLAATNMSISRKMPDAWVAGETPLQLELVVGVENPRSQLCGYGKSTFCGFDVKKYIPQTAGHLGCCEKSG